LPHSIKKWGNVDSARKIKTSWHITCTVTRDLLRDPDAFIQLLADIPFMNGALLNASIKPKMTSINVSMDFRIGLTDTLHVPNKVFFGENMTANLETVYNDKSAHDTKIRGLIHILNRYTIHYYRKHTYRRRNRARSRTTWQGIRESLGCIQPRYQNNWREIKPVRFIPPAKLSTIWSMKPSS
jgi:hypothetical protein